jgi:adenylate cyclase
VTLHDGDTLRFGHRELRFETGEGPRNEASDITLDGNTLMSRPESRVVTMLVADIEGFTALAAAMASDSLAMAVRSWCQACRRILKENEAVLDKFIGDSVFAWWAGDSPEIRNRALAAARAILAFESPPDTPPFSSGAALHCARVALCRLPDSTYTLLGSEVNTTFRMEPLTRQLGQPLIVSEAFASGFTPDHVSFVPCGSHHLKGLPGPVSVLAATPSRPA